MIYESFFDKRGKAMIFILLETGAGSLEMCNIDVPDVEPGSGPGQQTYGSSKSSEPGNNSCNKLHSVPSMIYYVLIYIFISWSYGDGIITRSLYHPLAGQPPLKRIPIWLSSNVHWQNSVEVSTKFVFTANLSLSDVLFFQFDHLYEKR